MNSKLKKVVNIVLDKVKHKEVIGVFKFKRSYLHDEELCFRVIKNIFVTAYYKEEHIPYKLYFKVERYKYDVLNVIDNGLKDLGFKTDKELVRLFNKNI